MEHTVHRDEVHDATEVRELTAPKGLVRRHAVLKGEVHNAR
jgi:hypothetical protein